MEKGFLGTTVSSSKVIYILVGIILSLASVTATLFIKDIRDDIGTVTTEMTRLKNAEIRDLIVDVQKIQTDLDRETYDKLQLVKDLSRLEEDIKDLEDQVR